VGVFAKIHHHAVGVQLVRRVRFNGRNNACRSNRFLHPIRDGNVNPRPRLRDSQHTRGKAAQNLLALTNLRLLLVDKITLAYKLYSNERNPVLLLVTEHNVVVRPVPPHCAKLDHGCDRLIRL